MLGGLQAKERDDFRDAEPGKIPVPTKNLIRAGCAYRLGHPNVLTVKTVEP